MNPTIVLYTHTDCKDVWPLIFGQTNKYLEDYKKIIFVNKFDEKIDASYKVITYDENYKYTDRIKNCLEQIEDEPILFFHEDMPLFDEPNHQVLSEFTELVKNKKADFIKLIKTADAYGKSYLHKNLIASKNYLFSIQPTITSTSNMLKIFSNSPNKNIWDFETEASEICIKNNLLNSFMSSCDDENKRGSNHFDSKIFPYIATAIVRGKWNYLEYEKELDFLLTKYSINKYNRGLFLIY